MELNSGCSSPKSASNEEFVSVLEQPSFSENLDSQCFESKIEHEKVAAEDSPDLSSGLISNRKSSDKRSRSKFNRDVSRREESDVLDSSADACSTSYDNTPSKENYIRHKVFLSAGMFLLIFLFSSILYGIFILKLLSAVQKKSFYGLERSDNREK